jgi:hypothetical protein
MNWLSFRKNLLNFLFKTSKKQPIILEECREYSHLSKHISKDVNMYPVALGTTWIYRDDLNPKSSLTLD